MLLKQKERISKSINFTSLSGFPDSSDEPFHKRFLGVISESMNELSFILLLNIANLSVFILQIIVDGLKFSSVFLEVKIGPLLHTFGRDYSSEKSIHELYRCFTSLFFHFSFMHLFDNTISITLWGSVLNHLLGNSFWRMMLGWTLAGISGDAFSSVFGAHNIVYAGASTGLAGIFGIFTGFTLLNWHRLANYQYPRYSVVAGLGIVIFMNLSWIFLGNYHKVDSLAHMGGFVAGIFAGMILADIPDSNEGPYEAAIKRIGLVCYVLFTGGCFAIVYVFR